MTDPTWADDDDALLAELRAALAHDASTADRVRSEGKAVFSWRTVDAELAALAHDSAGQASLAGARSEAASVRTLTFESGSLLVELGVAEGRLVGQLVPARSCPMALHRPGNDPVPVPVDDLGCFHIAPLPQGPFSLRISTPEGVTVATGWVTL